MRKAFVKFVIRTIVSIINEFRKKKREKKEKRPRPYHVYTYYYKYVWAN